MKNIFPITALVLVLFLSSPVMHFQNVVGSFQLFPRKARAIIALLIFTAISMASIPTAFADEKVQGLIEKSDPRKILTISESGADQEVRRQLIWDFTRIAFSDALWLENTIDPSASMIPFETHLARFDKGTTGSWLTDLNSISSGLPEPDRVVKWVGPVSIALGWPQYADQPPPSSPPELELIANDEINSLIPQLMSLTNIPIELRSHEDPREKTKEFSRIRVVFVDTTRLNNHFKMLTYQAGTYIEDWFYQLNTVYRAAIPFTSKSKSQVDGFLLADSSNELEFAVCRILSTLPPHLIRSLISECLLRSMGLPELSSDNESLLGAWNRYYDKTEMHPANEGKNALRIIPSLNQPNQNFYAKLPEGGPSDSPKMSAYDKKILSLLYCDVINPGMNKYEVITLLLQRKCVPHPDKKG